MSNKQDPFVSITTQDLAQVSGGAARVATGGSSGSLDDQLMLMLTQISDSIKDLAGNANGGTDQMTQMMMMMMMMGFGGGAAAAPAAPPPYVDVSGGCGKGW